MFCNLEKLYQDESHFDALLTRITAGVEQVLAANSHRTVQNAQPIARKNASRPRNPQYQQHSQAGAH